MPTVLVVDDSAIDRRLVGGLLEKIPEIKVLYASNGGEALERMKDESPNLVVADLIMPHVDGLELVATAVSSFPLIPVILMTGKGNEEIAVEALKAGAASYVPKSALDSRLVPTVENVLEMARLEQSEMRLMQFMMHNHCAFELENDFEVISPLVDFLHRSVRTVGLCDESNGIRVCVAIEEALNNAMVHGNLELTEELRREEESDFLQLFNARRRTSPFRDRKVNVEVKVSRDHGTFVIRDQGLGFRPDEVSDPTDIANLDKPRGRGLLLMRTFMDDIFFNEAGNEVTMIKRAGPRKPPAASTATS